MLLVANMRNSVRPIDAIGVAFSTQVSGEMNQVSVIIRYFS